MILEGIVTTISLDQSVNVSPMGPQVDDGMSRLVLKPYQTSTTYQNLKRTGEGVFHVVDDVELLARAAIGALETPPPMTAARAVQGWILSDACRWYALKVRALDDRQERTRIECDVVDRGALREFFGFNRGKHAVLEAAILATRTAFLPADEILSQFEQFQVLVDKTGGAAEQRALAILRSFVRRQFGLSAE